MRRSLEGSMPRWLRIVLGVVLVLVVGLGALWSWLDASEPVPETTSYRIDLDALRALAASLPGPKPRALRSVLVADAALPRGVVFAGEPFEAQHNVHQVFQIVFDDGSFGLVDTAFPPAAFERVGAFGDGSGRYHAEGWEQVTRALARADFVVVTHEHFDHLAGAASLPPERADRLRLNAHQLANAAALEESEIPAELRSRLVALPEREAQALAPGVVLLAAPGHTPGSQLVYVERADGRRALFLGDVAWHFDQIAKLHYRPRHVTFLLGENRAQVLDELRALHDLARAHPEVAQVVSHDPQQRAAYLADGLLAEGLELP
jgi:glyoxylase-like metal-dependent hydrolase (beta-lactamase superfamily II)